ncbi:MAG: TetR/AcrR family transcriptional regulator [Nocardioidaceae bacterium]
MSSIRHISEQADVLLDAARHCILAVGWKRTTLTDVARRAGVSRMTLYRRWPDMQTLLADLMAREWADMVADPRDEPAAGVTRTVRTLRDNALFRRIVDVDPELLLPYLLDRRGRTQDAMLQRLTARLGESQRAGTVRAGDPALLARTLLLAAYGFALSAHTMTGDPDEPTLEHLDAELELLAERYLAP